MTPRRVVVEIVSGVGSEERGLEGLRAALGLHRSFQGHIVDLVFRDKGVTWAVADGPLEKPEWHAIRAHLQAVMLRKVVERGSLETQSVPPETLMAGMEVVDATVVQEVLAAAEAHLVF